MRFGHVSKVLVPADEQEHRQLVGTATSLATAAAGAVLGSLLALALGALLGEPVLDQDTWYGAVAGIGIWLGLLGSLAAFGAAMVAMLRHVPARALWLPIALFPTLATLLLAIETFWME